MATILATLINLLLAFGVGILVMINGWGLEPKSWGWIIGGYFALTVTTVFVSTIAALARK